MPLSLIPPGQRKGNRYFLVRGSIGNRVYEKSTGTTDEKAARRILRQCEDAIRKAAPGDRVTFAEAARRYVEFRNPSRDDRRRIQNIVSLLGTRDIQGIHPADLHELAVQMYGEATAATRNREVLRPVTTILHYCADAGLCDWLRVRAFKEPRPKTRALDLMAAADLLAAANPGGQRRLLTWLFFQGTRITATLKLDWSQIDLDAGMVTLWNAKGDRSETFPLHEAVIAELRQVPNSSGPVFPWSNRSSLRRWLPALCRQVGVEFTPHMARHTLGTALAASGASLKTIMQALGHSQASSSLRYQSPDIEVVRAAVNVVQLPQAKKGGSAA